MKSNSVRGPFNDTRGF